MKQIKNKNVPKINDKKIIKNIDKNVANNNNTRDKIVENLKESPSFNDVNVNINKKNTKLFHSRQEVLVFEKLTSENNLSLGDPKTPKPQKVYILS